MANVDMILKEVLTVDGKKVLLHTYDYEAVLSPEEIISVRRTFIDLRSKRRHSIIVNEPKDINKFISKYLKP